MQRKRREKGRPGQVIVLAPAAIVVITGILAMSVDLGRMSVWRARLQNTADAAALAGMNVLVQQQLAGEPEEAAREAAALEACLIKDANACEAGVQIEFGVLDEDGAFEAAEESETATALRATAYRSAEAPGGRVTLIFAPLLGLEACGVDGSATCAVTGDILGVLTGLAPFAIPQDRLADPGEQMIFYPADGSEYDEGLGELTVAPGCWGLLNLDGGELSTAELGDWIRYGYDGEFALNPESGDLWIDGTTGFRAALQAAVNSRIGESMVMIVYDEVVGQGATAQFHATSFVSVTVESARLTGGNPQIVCTVDTIGILHDLLGGSGSASRNILKLQLVS